MADLNQLPDVLTADEIARYLRVSKTTVCRWCSTGRLPAFRIGRGWRVQRILLERFIELRPGMSAGARTSDWTNNEQQ